MSQTENETKPQAEPEVLESTEYSEQDGPLLQEEGISLGGDLDRAALEQKIKDLEDKYIRTHADFDNTKKRLEREKSQMIECAYEKFAKDLLPVIDALEMALASSSTPGVDASELLKKMQEGITHTLDNFSKVFGKHGIELVESSGEFNPHLHDAVMHAASDAHKEGEVVQTLQKGYKYKERVLRPAMVSICKK